MEELINNFKRNYGKFIQVYVRNKPYFWKGSGEILHGEILKELLDSLEVNYETNEDITGVLDEYGNIIKIPLSEGEDYRFVGAGWFEIIEEDKIRLRGKSQSYNLYPDKDNAEEISRLTGFKFVVD